ncbi:MULTISPECIES: DoxX family protein [Deefgea]|uniref:DoxX family membrane protein n=1 Tax=Deefgea chitinilytica TaxID=570276 RepID=A0ABS2C7E3_9NEIS|nr:MULTISPECIES: DoxX family protein [Deefgea]MBM5570069.1 DoxX family membrane protein [Deefgea chitinilytica]MBM9887298.1 DoxX family protein [Deefgea sp. CFH1-16]
MSRCSWFQRLAKAQSLDLLAPLADLLLRLYLAKAFFLSGLTKIADWETTLALFSDEYHVPLLSPYWAAIGGTVGELVLPVLLVFGLFTRLSAVGLFALNLVAVLSYYHVLKDIPAALQDHQEWALMLLVLAARPLSRWSLDAVLFRRCDSTERRNS